METSEPLNSQSEALDESVVEPVAEPVAEAAAPPAEEAMVVSHIHHDIVLCV